MGVRSIVSTGAALSIATLAVWSTAAMGVTAAQTPETVPATLAPVSSSVRAIIGNIASGSASAQQPGFDPGPYPDRQSCENARARYYDPSQLECVPV